MSKPVPSRVTKRYVSIGALIAVVLLAYFLIVPGVLASDYKNKALPAQNKISEKITALGEQYKRPAFTKIDTTPAADKADYEATRLALGEARNQFTQQKDILTGFRSWPLMNLSGEYNDATTASRDAKEWVTKSEQLLAAAEADLIYFEKVNALDLKFENAGTALESLTGEESPAVVAQKMDQLAAEIQGALTEAKQIQPSESLKKSHDSGIAFAEKFLSQFKELATAVRTDDMGKAEVLSAQIDATIVDADNASNQDIIDYARTSAVSKLVADLAVLDRKLEDDFQRF